MGADAYRRMAGMYDQVVEPAAAALRRKGMEILPPREDISILDVGCGTGTQLALYRRPGCRLAGVDLSPSMVERAKAKLGDAAEIRCEDATRMTFESGSFDVVMLVTVLHELPPALWRPLLDECVRVTRTDGSILVLDYHTGPYPFPRGWVWKSVITFMELLAGRDHFANYRTFMRSGGLDGLISATGLSIANRYIPESRTAAAYLLRPAVPLPTIGAQPPAAATAPA